jgi:uncharacterized protein (TIGR01440 family)
MSVNGMADKAMEASFLTQVHEEAKAVVYELLEQAKTEEGDILVVGCSSSEVAGEKIGTFSSVETAQAVFEGIYEAAKAKGMFLAAQCCEHLNRALVVEREAAEKFGFEQVNAIPQVKAGGSFATAAYKGFCDPVLVEFIKADAGLDIGDTFIGMHLKHVAVPTRLSVKKIGEANLTAARVRPKFVGGSRAVYDENLM